MAEQTGSQPGGQPGAAAATAPAGGAGGGAQSTTSSTAPAGPAGRLNGLDEATAKAAADGFGDAYAPLAETTAPAPAGAQPGADAAAGGQPGGTDTTTAEGAAAGEQPAPLPFDDELAGLQPLNDGTTQQPVNELVDLDSPEKVLKALNPTGTATEADQLKHAQQLIGRFSKQAGQAKEVLSSLAPFMQRDQAGNYVGFDVLAIADRMEQQSPGAIAALLASRQQKIVPADWGQEQATLDREYPKDLVDQLVPNKDMSFEEKVELIKSDSEKLVELRVEKGARVAAQRAQAQQLYDEVK